MRSVAVAAICISVLGMGTNLFAQVPTVTPMPRVEARVMTTEFPIAAAQVVGAGGAAPTPCPSPLSTPQLTTPLREGATQVTGTGTAFQSPCTAQMSVYDVSSGTPALLGLVNPSVASSGSFSATLAEPLHEGQKIAVREIFTGTSGGTIPADNAGLLAAGVDVVVPGDWGRVKAYFTSGILISQNQQSFSQSSLFMGFTLDKAWMLPGYYHPPLATKPKNKSQKGRWKWPGLNTFFDVRLTQIPVSACSSSGSSSSSNQSSPCTTPAATPSPSPAPSPSATPTNLETFLSSQKTARLAVGIYFPWTFTTWNYNKTPNALFIAPLAKVGFDTPAGSLNQTEPASASSGATTTNTGTVTAVNQANFYNFYTFGARIGHYALTSSSDRAPDLVSYLDVGFGPFSNLETLFVPTGTVVTPTTPLGVKRLYRLNVEGILKVPTTPLIVGLSANVGQETLGTGGIHIVQRAGDDLRFLFGVKFDVAKLLAKVTGSAP